MWSLLFSFLGSGACGSILGSLFAWLNKKNELKELQIKQAHEATMKGLEQSHALALADKARAQVQEAGEQAVANTEAQAFVVSQEAAKDQWKWVRPVAMFYLLAAATLIGVYVSFLVGGLSSLDNEKLMALYVSIIDQIFFLTNLAVSWFFGARGSSRKPKH